MKTCCNQSNPCISPCNSPNILLVGQPNVGKSVLFSRITGIRTISSNYHGTTVSFTKGQMSVADKVYSVVDAPGTYSLEPLDDAARVTIDLINKSEWIINVIDATHLERNLPLTMELLAQKKRVIIALNMSDEARHKGIEIDIPRLEEELKVKIIPTVACTGEGVAELISQLMQTPVEDTFEKQDGPQHSPPKYLHLPGHLEDEEIPKDHRHMDMIATYGKIGEILSRTQTLRHRHHTPLEILEDLSVHPLLGPVLTLIILFLSFSTIRFIGEFLIGGGIGIFGDPWFELPFGTELLFNKLLLPLLESLSSFLGKEGIVHDLLIGKLVNGQIDFVQSFGMLTTGLFIPLGSVLPYIISFYFVMSLLEDVGYLPRLAVFLDNIMHKLGLHGHAIIPMMLGLGCNVPGIIATRILETRLQRFITATLISIAIPCMAMQAMIIGIVGKRGFLPLITVYGILFSSWIVIGLIMKMTTKGSNPELLLEIPPYRLPNWKALGIKMWMRTLDFLKEALPIVIGAIFVVNLLDQIHLFEFIANLTSPIITKLWGMPKETVLPLVIGILRKDVAVGMFVPLALTTKQLVTGVVVLTMFFPCIATFVILFKELGIVDGLRSMAIMLASVLIIGMAINFLG